MSTRYAPSPPWTLRCTRCDFHVLVNARGMSGNDPGSGVEAAQIMERHIAEHGLTWQCFLRESEAAISPTEESSSE